MAYHMYIVCSVLVTGWATSTLGAPPVSVTSGLTLETCGVSQPCGPTDSYTIPCPASKTCNEYYKCEKGTPSIQTCDKSFYMFWMTPVFDTTNNCCKLVFTLSPGACNGEARPEATLAPEPLQAAEHSNDEDEPNGLVKRHAEPAGVAGVAGVAGAASTTLPLDVKGSEGNAATLAAPVTDAAEPHVIEPPKATELPGLEPSKSEKIQQDLAAKKTSSSACVPTAPFLAIVIAVLTNLVVRRSIQ